jgi:hypothetical protein
MMEQRCETVADIMERLRGERKGEREGIKLGDCDGDQRAFL